MKKFIEFQNMSLIGLVNNTPTVIIDNITIPRRGQYRLTWGAGLYLTWGLAPTWINGTLTINLNNVVFSTRNCRQTPTNSFSLQPYQKTILAFLEEGSTVSMHATIECQGGVVTTRDVQSGSLLIEEI